jgi:LAO/AO transport system kinase
MDRQPRWPDTLAAIRAGDRRLIARAITALENGATGTRQPCAPRWPKHAGRAHVVGITGPPGGGKSTLVSALIKALRARGQTRGRGGGGPVQPLQWRRRAG